MGGTGKLTGNSLFVSEGYMLGIIMKFGALDYPGDYFAYDGEEVTVSHINPGQRSPLDRINGHAMQEDPEDRVAHRIRTIGKRAFLWIRQ